MTESAQKIWSQVLSTVLLVAFVLVADDTLLGFPGVFEPVIKIGKFM